MSNKQLCCATLGLLISLSCQAQLIDLLKSLAPTAAGIVQKNEDAASAALTGAATPGGPQGKKAADIETELAPDRQCNRPQEKFNISEKLMEFGGAEASLRLQRLVESDYKYDDIQPEDRKLLRYLAQTTVWVPVWLESKLGAAFDLIGGRPGELTPIEEQTFAEVRQRAGKFHALTTDFPGEINLSLNPELADGAFAKFGGRVQISRNMLQLMDDKRLGADFVLAHEMAHVYKRHEIKRLQYQLISSRDGWELGKKVLQRAQRGPSFEPLRDGLFMLSTVPALITFVQTMQLRFSSEQELEADACAARWLKASAQDPSTAWLEFRDAFAQGSGEQTYGQTHPPTSEREANFIRKVEGKPAPSKSGGAKQAVVQTGAKPKPKPGP
jgi:Zn-dependent protease with chaperone function